MRKSFETPQFRPSSDAAELGLIGSTAFYTGSLKPLANRPTATNCRRAAPLSVGCQSNVQAVKS